VAQAREAPAVSKNSSLPQFYGRKLQLPPQSLRFRLGSSSFLTEKMGLELFYTPARETDPMEAALFY